MKPNIQRTMQSIGRIASRISWLLPVGLLLIGLGSSSNSPFTVHSAGAEATPPLAVGAELVDRRTAFSRHTYLGQGHFQAEIASRPLHYRDPQGGWQPVDTTLLPLPDGGYANQSNGLRLFLPANSHGWVRVESNYGILNAWASGVDATRLPVTYWLAWRTQSYQLIYPDGRGEKLGEPAQAVALAVSNRLVYPNVLPFVDERYQSISYGLKHSLFLMHPPTLTALQSDGAVFEAVFELELPANLKFYTADGEQSGDFELTGPLELRTSEGQPVFVFRSPLAYEQDDPRQKISGSYAITHRAGRTLLAWRFPASWLLDPLRRYPVILDPTLDTVFGGQDTYLATTVTDPQGGSTQLLVGADTVNAYHTLMSRAGFGDLPASALIDGDSNSDVQIKLYLFDTFSVSGGWGAGTEQTIGAYEVTNLWVDDDADWTHRTNIALWTTPGGDHIGGLLDEVATADVGITPGFYTWMHFRLRDLISLWRTYLSYPNIATYGKPPYGLLLKFLDETQQEVKLFSSSERTGETQDPRLVINYQSGPLALTHDTPIQRRVPSPDYFSIPSSSYWQAVGLRVIDSASTNIDLELYEYDSYTSRSARSAYPAGNVDLVVIDQQVENHTRYPFTYSQNGGAGNYRLEYQYRKDYLGQLDIGDTFGPFTLQTGDVFDLFTFLGRSTGDPCLQITVTSGNARLGAAIFAPGGPSGRIYSRDEASSQTVASTGAASLKLCPQDRLDGVYGLVVWSEGGTLATTYQIVVSDYEMYLPLIRRN